MYDNKKQILVPSPKLQSNFLFFMNICKTIDIIVVEFYNFKVYFTKMIIQKMKSKLWIVFGSELRFRFTNEKRSRAEPSRPKNPSARAMARASSAWAHHY